MICYIYESSTGEFLSNISHTLAAKGRNYIDKGNALTEGNISTIKTSNVLNELGQVNLYDHNKINAQANDAILTLGWHPTKVHIAMAGDEVAILRVGKRNGGMSDFVLAHIVHTKLCHKLSINEFNPSMVYVLLNSDFSITGKRQMTEHQEIATGQGIAQIADDIINKIDKRAPDTLININGGNLQLSDKQMLDLEPSATNTNGYHDAWCRAKQFIASDGSDNDILRAPEKIAWDLNQTYRGQGPTSPGAQMILLNHLIQQTLNSQATENNPLTLAKKILHILPSLEQFNCPLISTTTDHLINYLQDILKSGILERATQANGSLFEMVKQKVQKFIIKYQDAPVCDATIVCLKEIQAPSHGLQQLQDTVFKASPSLKTAEALTATKLSNK